jgi:hypothetical protein
MLALKSKKKKEEVIILWIREIIVPEDYFTHDIKKWNIFYKFVNKYIKNTW